MIADWSEPGMIKIACFSTKLRLSISYQVFKYNLYNGNSVNESYMF